MWDSRTEMYNMDTHEIGVMLLVNVNVSVSFCTRNSNEENNWDSDARQVKEGISCFEMIRYAQMQRVCTPRSTC